MSTPVLDVVFPNPEEFLSAYENEVSNGGLLVRTHQSGLSAGTSCRIRLDVKGAAAFEVEAQVAAVARFGVSVVFKERPVLIDRLALSLQAAGARSTRESSPRLRPVPVEKVTKPTRAPIISTPESVSGDPAVSVPEEATSDKLASMTLGERMSAALAGGRNVRISLLRDLNKAVHLYVLRNPRIGLDEVRWAAKLPSLSVEALRAIWEHGQWGNDPGIVAALVRNPQTPLSLALRLLSRLSPEELRAITESGLREPIVQAAREKLAA